jgi:GINS complex subunit 4
LYRQSWRGSSSSYAPCSEQGWQKCVLFRLVCRHIMLSAVSQIDAYPHHTLALSQASPTALSHLESQYLHHHQHLLSSHYNTAFLSSFPVGLRKLDDTAGGISMIDKPDEDNAVFCRILRDAGQVEVQGEQGAGTVELNRGDVWVLRWRDVKQGVERGDIELI